MNAHWSARALEAAVRYVAGLASAPAPATLSVALSVTSADPDGPGFTELSVANYARQTLTMSYSGGYPGAHSALNATAAVSFVNLGAGSYLGVGIFDEADLLWFWADLDTPVVIATGQSVTFAAATIRVAVLA